MFERCHPGTTEVSLGWVMEQVTAVRFGLEIILCVVIFCGELLKSSLIVLLGVSTRIVP